MIVLWIFVALVAFATLLLFIPLTLALRWDKSLSLTLRFLFLRFDLMKLMNKEPKKKIEKKSQKKTPSVLKKEKKKRSLSEFIDFIGFLAKILKTACTELICRLRIRIVSLHLVIADEQPDRTAILYGMACPAVYQLCETAKRFTRSKIDYRKIDVNADFTQKSFRAELDLRFSLRPIDIIITGAKALALLQEIKLNSGGNDRE